MRFMLYIYLQRINNLYLEEKKDSKEQITLMNLNLILLNLEFAAFLFKV